jgi:hypothetical protein
MPTRRWTPATPDAGIPHAMCGPPSPTAGEPRSVSEPRSGRRPYGDPVVPEARTRAVQIERDHVVTMLEEEKRPQALPPKPAGTDVRERDRRSSQPKPVALVRVGRDGRDGRDGNAQFPLERRDRSPPAQMDGRRGRRSPRSLSTYDASRTPSEPEPLERLRIASPAGANLHHELEVHGMTEQGFDLRSGTRPDLADHRASLADEDSLL